MIKAPAFLRENPRLALYAFVAVAASGFGQTFFVSVMGGELRQAFELSHSAYGSLYSGATLLSAVLLLRFGGLADAWSLPRVTTLAVAVLAAGCLIIGLAPSSLFLGLGFVLIRFGGQGFMAHLGITTAARFFSAQRGKAVAMAELGFPLAEAALPAGAVFLMASLGWRCPWLTGLLVLAAVVWPLLMVLSRKVPVPAQLRADTDTSRVERSFTRGQVLQDTGFYLVLPATVIAPFTVTALFFHQVAIAQIQGWSVQLLGAAFSGYALGHLLTLFAAGSVVDRLSAGKTLPLALLPLASSLLLLGLAQGEWVAFVYLVLVGITQGLVATAGGAVWAERYGVLHLGAIRAMTQAVMVVSTAVAPVLLGILLDVGVGLPVLATGMAAAVVMVALLACISLLRESTKRGEGSRES
jgi:predicted MFS family arabinose efflux permease